MALVDLLPPNATQLEKDIIKVIEEHTDIDSFIDKIPKAKFQTIPDSFIPFLIDEYKLGEVAEFLTDPRVAIAEGIKWHRIKGTPEALDIALGWIGFVPDSVDESLYERPFDFHIDTGEIPAVQLIRNIVRLAQLSKPARSRLIRLYHDYNSPPFELNGTELNEGILSNFSGFYDEENDVWLSFWFNEKDLVDMGLDLTVYSGSSVRNGTVVDRDDGYTILNGERTLALEVYTGTFILDGVVYYRPKVLWTDILPPDKIIGDDDFVVLSGTEWQ